MIKAYHFASMFIAGSIGHRIELMLAVIAAKRCAEFVWAKAKAFSYRISAGA